MSWDEPSRGNHSYIDSSRKFDEKIDQLRKVVEAEPGLTFGELTTRMSDRSSGGLLHWWDLADGLRLEIGRLPKLFKIHSVDGKDRVYLSVGPATRGSFDYEQGEIDRRVSELMGALQAARSLGEAGLEYRIRARLNQILPPLDGEPVPKKKVPPLRRPRTAPKQPRTAPKRTS